MAKKVAFANQNIVMPQICACCLDALERNTFLTISTDDKLLSLGTFVDSNYSFRIPYCPQCYKHVSQVHRNEMGCLYALWLLVALLGLPLLTLAIPIGIVRYVVWAIFAVGTLAYLIKVYGPRKIAKGKSLMKPSCCCLGPAAQLGFGSAIFENDHFARAFIQANPGKSADLSAQSSRESAHLGDQEIAQLSQQAAQFYQQGDYGQAINIAAHTCELARQRLGEKHLDFANSLNSLALLYCVLGNYVAAEPLYRQVLDIFRTDLGEKHPDFATSLNNLAGLYCEMGNYLAAEPLFRQVLEIRRTVLGEKHSGFAASLNNLAFLYYTIGIYANAEPLYHQAVEIQRTILGENHPEFVVCLKNLASLYRATGNYVAAEPLYRQTLVIQRTDLGENHPHFAASLGELAWLSVAMEREDEALALMQKAAAVDDQMIGQVFSTTSEAQRVAYLKTIDSTPAKFLSLVSQHFPTSRTAAHAALELVLRRKAISAEALAVQRDAVLGGKYPVLKSKLQEITTLRMQIAQKALTGPGTENISTYRQVLGEWNTQKEKLEAGLTRKIPEMNLEQRLRGANQKVVALALPENATLVEFVRFVVVDFKAVPARGESQWKPARYLAFVLPAGEPDNLQMIDLGEAEPIERMIATFRAAITEEDESAGERGLGAWPGAQGGAASGGAGGGRGEREGQALRAALFDPLVEALGRRTRLLLAPDGDLTRLPFEVLPLDDGRRLIDAYQISYLGAGRDVLRWRAAVSGEAGAPLVAADPDFDLGQAAGRAAEGEVRGRRSRDLAWSTEPFGRLPGTRAEGERIAALLGVRPWLGGEAVEQRIKQCRSPRILHLATHGFFLQDQPRDLNREARGLGALMWQAGGSFAAGAIGDEAEVSRPVLLGRVHLSGRAGAVATRANK